jgi:peptide chain release factor 2
MEELKQKLRLLQQEVNKLYLSLNISHQEQEYHNLLKVQDKESFWKDSQKAQEIIKKAVSLKNRIEGWVELKQELDELLAISELNDKTLIEEIQDRYNVLNQNLSKLKELLKFSGEFDSNDAIISIYAGAGGTDAQDWTQILFRMYVRWAEKHSYEFKVLEENIGEEAGLKSVTFEIIGEYAFARLKNEKGVHRLVRLSPFNADNLRQTSFAKVEVIPKLNPEDDFDLDEKDLKIDVFRSGGHGGQSVNTTDSAVRITHLPTNIVVTIQNERSQLQNKELALTILRSKLAEIKLEQHVQKITELKGPNLSAEWGNQIRSYVLHPYKQVKDQRSGYVSKDPSSILDGNIDDLIDSNIGHLRD